MQGVMRWKGLLILPSLQSKENSCVLESAEGRHTGKCRSNLFTGRNKPRSCRTGNIFHELMGVRILKKKCFTVLVGHVKCLHLQQFQ